MPKKITTVSSPLSEIDSKDLQEMVSDDEFVIIEEEESDLNEDSEIFEEANFFQDHQAISPSFSLDLEKISELDQFEVQNNLESINFAKLGSNLEEDFILPKEISKIKEFSKSKIKELLPIEIIQENDSNPETNKNFETFYPFEENNSGLGKVSDEIDWFLHD